MNFKIKEKRIEKGMTQEELAEKSGISRASILSYENGTAKNITVKNLESIADALNCKIEELFCYD